MRRFHLKLYKGKISPLMMNPQIVLCRAKSWGPVFMGIRALQGGADCGPKSGRAWPQGLFALCKLLSS
jgi:hypothetical protein